MFVPLQIVLGDMHGLNTRQYQPAKLAAIEGRYDTARRAPLTLFGIPDDAAERMDYAIEVPWLGSLILTHSLDGEIKGLKDFPPDQRPPVGFVFYAFRIMVGIGFVMLGVVALAWWLRWRGRLFQTGWFLVAVPIDGAARLRRRARGMDDDGSRPPALDGLRADAD